MHQTSAPWKPSRGRVKRSNLAAFQEFAAADGAPQQRDYATLWRWSVAEPEKFWLALAQFAKVIWERGPGPVLANRDLMPGCVWFGDSRLNFAENLLAHRDSRPALIFTNERGARRQMSYAQLYDEVKRIAAGLREIGIQPGDRVAGYLPNLPETVVAMLATTSLGAVWTSCSPDFGVSGVIDRFGQTRPRVLFTADGYFYGGKSLDSRKPICSILEQLPSVERVVVVPYLSPNPGLPGIDKATLWSDFGQADQPLEFQTVAFNAPLYILYSSGTTGVPKCIVHGVGGTLLQHRKEHLLHCDLKPQDKLFFFTTCGWMMWNWLTSALATGCTLILYDGSPFFPDPEVLWRMAERERVTHFGTSAKYLSALEKSGCSPAANFDLAAMRVLMSTGSPLAPEQFDYVYARVKADVQLASISGGTDIIACFALGNPYQPVYRGELQGPGLGMATQVVDDAGNAVIEKQGELVCSAPFPSMPIGFWDDPQDRCYRAAYFERFEGIWHHGDYALQTNHGGFIILGRSDALLNPGGVRIGTAEIYRQVEKLGEVVDSIAIGQEWAGDVRVVLFVRLRLDITLDTDLEQQIRNVIRSNTTPRHVPARIVAVPDIPRTMSGKIAELAVREAVHGRPVNNVDALANPEALSYFRNVATLRD